MDILSNSEEMTKNAIAKKFTGCLLGSLVGDCLGAKFEYQGRITVKKVDEFFDYLKEEKIKDVLSYTDDTAMMKVLAKSIIEKGSVDTVDLANKFSEEYYKDPNRGYGKHVVNVFSQLQKKSLDDVLQPARDQFNGNGSYGNGAAMRVAPVALMHFKDTDKMIEAARNSALVTHAHQNGYNGAILQCLAIQMALSQDPNSQVDSNVFVKELLEKMTQIEQNESNRSYCEKLKTMEKLLTQIPPPTLTEVIDQLGNNVSGLKSVPTAIFAYLFAQKPLDQVSVENQYERMIRYIISLGGDTDTIACMAGGIIGAHLGVDAIPSHLIEVCEDNKIMVQLAEVLFKIIHH